MSEAGTRSLRLALVVQRYGLEINGGAELHARHFATILAAEHDVTVLTTRALDYTRWDHHYAGGEDQVAGVRVLRFDHPQGGHRGRARVPKRHVLRYRLRGLMRILGRTNVAAPGGSAFADGWDYLEAQGPFSTALMEHLAQARGRYDVVLFFTARYHPAAAGVLACTAPCVLVPTLHDERSMHVPLFHQVFRKPALLLWNCEAERALARQLYGDDLAPGLVCGDAVAVPEAPPDQASKAAAQARTGIDGPYFVFVGRVSRSKGFHVLLKAFGALQRRHGGRCRLVVIGQSFMAELPQAPGVIYAGFVEETERDALMAGAVATVVTSRHESLSLVTLESLALGVPVIVNGGSPVLRQHVQATGAGRIYRAGSPLEDAMESLWQLPDSERQAMHDAGRRYVQQHYAPERVRQTLLQAVASAAGQPATQASGNKTTV